MEKILEQHAEGREWTSAELEDVLQNNTLYPWDATAAANAGAMRVVRGEGVYFYDDKGKKYLDFNSQVCVCVCVCVCCALLMGSVCFGLSERMRGNLVFSVPLQPACAT